MKISVLLRIGAFAAIVAAAYWYWSGPYQDRVHPSYRLQVQENDEKMRECNRAAAYKLGATGTGAGLEIAEKECAEQYNVYQLDGHWYSYDTVRPDSVEP